MHDHYDALDGPDRLPARRQQNESDEAVHEREASESHDPRAAAMLRLQRSAGNAAVADAMEDPSRSPVLDVVGRGGGRPLEARTRVQMERAIGADLSSVRVHDDAAASASAKAVQARAYTVGNDVVFRSGEYQPETRDGQRTLAHELTHVVQQRSGPVDGTPAAGGIRVSDPGDPFERAADENANRIVDQSSPVQRAPEEDELEDETVQALAVQREAEEDEEEMT
jgi:hypothetical protein